jgi:hypothetical protein
VSLDDLRDGLRRAGSAPHLAGLVSQVRAAAAEAAATGMPPPPPWSLYRRFAETGDRLGYERAYFARRGRLVALAAASVIDGDPRIEAALADALWSVCDEWTWALPAHAWLVNRPDRDMPRCVDLFAGETAHTLAETVALLGDRLPGPVAERVRSEVHRRVLDPYLGDPRPWRWESATHNWSAVCAGAAGMAALALWSDPTTAAPGRSAGPPTADQPATDQPATDQPTAGQPTADQPTEGQPTEGRPAAERAATDQPAERLTRAVARCRTAMAAYLSGLGADGGCAEGIGYWTYGFGYFVYFAEALRVHTGQDLLRESPVAAAAARFPAAVQLAPDRFVSFSDTSEPSVLPPGLLSRLRERLGAPVPTLTGVPDLGADHCHRWAHLSRTLAWTDPATVGGALPSRGGCWLPELAWLVDRRTVADLPVAFAAKGGHNDEPHNHNDLGTFILAVGGEQLLVDLGAGEYRGGYFSADRYRFLHAAAEGHSVPVVDGRAQCPGRGAVAVVRGVARHDRGAELALDLSAAYGDGRRVRRGFTWWADGTLTVTDDFTGATDVDELFISRTPPRVVDGVAIWRGRAGAALLRFDPAVWWATVEPVATRDHHGAPETVHRLRLRSRTPPGVTTFRFTLGTDGPRTPADRVDVTAGRAGTRAGRARGRTARARRRR